MKLTAEDLFEAREDLRAALALIPPLKLLRFDANIVPQEDIALLPRPTLRLSNVRFLIRILVHYEGCNVRLPFYVTDTGIIYTQWFLQPYLTHPIHDAARNWFHATWAKKVRQVAKARIAPIKEELMAAAWHPKRVERYLAFGSYEMLD